MAATSESPPHPLVALLANLSSVATLFTIIAVAVGASQKLDALESRGAQNCRGINAAIILTLESSRPRAIRQHNEAALDRTITRFERLSAAC